MWSFKKNNNRKILLINPKFQGRMIAYGLVASVLILAAFLFANYLLFDQVQEIGNSLGIASANVFTQSLDMVFTWYNYMIISVGLIVVAVLMVMMLVITHRIAGPIYKLLMYLEKIQNGEQSYPVKFREGDFFPELAEAINLTIKKLHPDLLKDPPPPPIEAASTSSDEIKNEGDK